MKTDLQNTFTHILLIIFLGLLSYSNTFEASFQFDDKPAIVNNPIIKHLRYFAHPSEAKDFTGHFEYKVFKRRYVGYLTFALNYRLHQLRVAGYHIFNIAVHICSALLLYLLVTLTFQTPKLSSSSIKENAGYIALFTALLFACHPVQTQAVTYIFQRVTSLATMFYLLSLVAYIKWRLIHRKTELGSQKSDLGQEHGRLKSVLFYMGSLVSAVLGMKTKEIVFMLPPVILLYDIMFFEGSSKKRLSYIAPMFLSLLIIPLSLLNIERPAGELINHLDDVTRGHTPLSRWQYLLTSSRAMLTYIRLIFIPVHQTIEYDYPVYGSFFDSQVIISIAVLAVIFVFSVYILFRYRDSVPHVRIISFGIFWFFINFALESGVIPLNNVIFEHRLYLPSIGAFLVISVSSFMLMQKWKDRYKRIDKMVFTAMAVTVVVLTGATYARNSVWKDELTLWSDVVDKNPGSARAHNNLCFYYNDIALFEKAVDECNIAIKLNPDNQSAYYNNLGNAYVSLGDIEKAIENYIHATTIESPYQDQAHYNLARIYKSLGSNDKAIEHYQAALELNPNYALAYNNLGNIYQSQGLTEKATEHYVSAIRLDPGYADPHINLGNIYMSKNLIDDAIEEYEAAIKINFDVEAAHYNLAVAYRLKGLLDKAEQHFKIAQILGNTKKPILK